MKPVVPVVPGYTLPETVYAKDQPEYNPLPSYRMDDGTVLSRWKMSWKERLIAFFRGDVYLWVSTYNKPLQPLMMQVERPEMRK